MAHHTNIKYCGLTTQKAVQEALNLHIEYCGFVCVAQSPRYRDAATFKKLSTIITQHKGYKSNIVGLFAHQTLDDIMQYAPILQYDLIQLHGQESPAFCANLKKQSAKPIIKAFFIDDTLCQNDITAMITPYIGTIDYILLDTKAPKNSTITGGHGVSFNWSIIQNIQLPCPIFLAGGLHADNVGEAIKTVAPYALDVSSHIEGEKGIKDTQKMQHFAHMVEACNQH